MLNLGREDMVGIEIKVEPYWNVNAQNIKQI